MYRSSPFHFEHELHHRFRSVFLFDAFVVFLFESENADFGVPIWRLCGVPIWAGSRELPDQATGSPTPLQPVTSPSLLAGGCYGVSKQPQPNSNTSGFTKPMWPNSHTSLYLCRRTTQPDSAWAADTHAYVGRENQTHSAHTMPSNDIPSDYTTFSNTTKRNNYHLYPQTTANSPPRMTSWRSFLPPFPSPTHHWQDQDHTVNRYLDSENTYVVFQGPNSFPDSDTPWKPYNWSVVGGLTQWNTTSKRHHWPLHPTISLPHSPPLDQTFNK